MEDKSHDTVHTRRSRLGSGCGSRVTGGTKPSTSGNHPAWFEHRASRRSMDAAQTRQIQYLKGHHRTLRLQHSPVCLSDRGFFYRYGRNGVRRHFLLKEKISKKNLTHRAFLSFFILSIWFAFGAQLSSRYKIHNIVATTSPTVQDSIASCNTNARYRKVD